MLNQTREMKIFSLEDAKSNLQLNMVKNNFFNSC